MPALLPTAFTGTITWLGHVADRAATLRASPLTAVMATFAGLDGEAHGGEVRASCSRMTAQYPQGTMIRNVRQLSVLGAEDLDAIAARMGIESVDPVWLGASMVIAGIPDFTRVPPSSRLQGASGATLVVDMENRPCNWPAKEIEIDRPGKGKAFRSAADGRRGVTAWVEREGMFAVGDSVTLHVPDQPVWPHLALARKGLVARAAS